MMEGANPFVGILHVYRIIVVFVDVYMGVLCYRHRKGGLVT